MTYKTEQESFWAGNFGVEYIERNKSAEYLASNLNFFSKALARVGTPDSLIEFGPNIGMNLKAIKLLFPHIDLSAVEINEDAAKILEETISKESISQCSIFDFEPSKKDFMFNYRVENLTVLMSKLKEEGVKIVGEIEEYEYGKFSWITDPEGNKIELWEPIDAAFL